MSAVIMPPVLNEMYFGARFEKSNDGETTFAAMFVEIWAITMMIMAMMSSAGMLPVTRVTTSTGSQIASPKTTIVAAVTAMPDEAEGRHREREDRGPVPRTWERWVFA